MKKAIIFLLLLMLAGTAAAQSLGGRWSLVANMNEADVYIDTTTLREVDNQISVWSFVIYEDPLIMNEVNEPVARIKSNYLFNTISDKYSTVGTLYYDRSGRIVGEAANQRFGARDRFAQSIEENTAIDLIYRSVQSFLKGGGTRVDDFRAAANDVSRAGQTPDAVNTPGTEELRNEGDNNANGNAPRGTRVTVPPVKNMPLTPPPLTLGSGGSNDDDDESTDESPATVNDGTEDESPINDMPSRITYEDHERNMVNNNGANDQMTNNESTAENDAITEDMSQDNITADDTSMDTGDTETAPNDVIGEEQEEKPLELDSVPDDNRIVLPDVNEEESDYPRSDPPQPLNQPEEEDSAISLKYPNPFSPPTPKQNDSDSTEEYTFTDENETMMTDEDDTNDMTDMNDEETTYEEPAQRDEDAPVSKGKRIYDPTTGEYIYMFDSSEAAKPMREDDGPRSDPPLPLPFNKYNADNERNVTSTIFTDGNTYVVQVASFRRKSVAEGEVERLKNKGHDAFLTEANIPSKGGMWYRVRVGYFGTQQEARQAQRNIK